jgi:hypothetical protein
VGYCVRSDLYSFGLPRGTIPNPGRLVLSVDATTNAMALGDHEFATGDPLVFRAEMGGSMPAPLVAGTRYYAIALTDGTFQVSATASGAAIDLTSAGAEVLVSSPLPVEESIEWGAEVINQALVNHAVPLTAPYPPMVVMANAELAAGKLGLFSGGTAKSLTDMMARTTAQLQAWAKGLSVRGENTAPTERTNLAASASVPYLDSRGWARFGGPTRIC